MGNTQAGEQVQSLDNSIFLEEENKQCKEEVTSKQQDKEGKTGPGVSDLGAAIKRDSLSTIAEPPPSRELTLSGGSSQVVDGPTVESPSLGELTSSRSGSSQVVDGPKGNETGAYPHNGVAASDTLQSHFQDLVKLVEAEPIAQSLVSKKIIHPNLVGEIGLMNIPIKKSGKLLLELIQKVKAQPVWFEDVCQAFEAESVPGVDDLRAEYRRKCREQMKSTQDFKKTAAAESPSSRELTSSGSGSSQVVEGPKGNETGAYPHNGVAASDTLQSHFQDLVKLVEAEPIAQSLVSKKIIHPNLVEEIALMSIPIKKSGKLLLELIQKVKAQPVWFEDVCQAFEAESVPGVDDLRAEYRRKCREKMKSTQVFKIPATPPKIVAQPQGNRVVIPKQTLKLTIKSTGREPLKYSWEWNSSGEKVVDSARKKTMEGEAASDAIRTFFAKLCKQVTPEDVVPTLFTKKMINKREMQHATNKYHHEEDRVQALLLVLMQNVQSRPHWFHQICETFDEAHIANTQDIREEYQKLIKEAEGWNPLPADVGRYEGVHTPTLTITTVQRSDQGSYRCIVYNDVGSETSQPAVVTVAEAPRITSDPQDYNEAGQKLKLDKSLQYTDGATAPPVPFNLAQLALELSSFTDWHHLGVFLKVSIAELDVIEENHVRDTVRKRTEMLKIWMEQDNASWETLVTALVQLKQKGLAKRIAQKCHISLSF